MDEKQKLIQMLKENEQIQRYKAIEKVINENEDLKHKINQLKTVQKQLVNAKEIQKEKAIHHFKEVYDTLSDEIDSYPLMSDYLDLQGDINEMIQTINEILEDGINKELNSL